MKRVGSAASVAVALLAVVLPVAARPERGSRVAARVTRVIDGDTLEVDLAGESRRIRLAEIDAPEKDQPWGGEATAALRNRVANREIELDVVDVDRYERLVCTVYLGGVNINRALVESGHVWAYTDYAKDLRVIALEKQARAARRGLWSLPERDRNAPWEWRRGHRGGRRNAVEFKDPRCSKRTCKEMDSCEEARFHLEHCGLSRLDGDRDGVPCESLCKSKGRAPPPGRSVDTRDEEIGR